MSAEDYPVNVGDGEMWHESDDEIKGQSEAERQAELHWAYVQGVLLQHHASGDTVKMVGFHYKTAFIHGWKHGQEAMNGKAKG